MVIIRDNQVKSLRAQRRIEAGAQDELDWAAVGCTLHNLYDAIESQSLRVPKSFGNALSPDTWHRGLISRDDGASAGRFKTCDRLSSIERRSR